MKTSHHSYLVISKNKSAQYVWIGNLLGKVFPDSSRGVVHDVLVLKPEITGTSGRAMIGIRPIRSVKQFIYSSGIYSKSRIVIVHSAETMTTQASNALLKILEEPPQNRVIVLLAGDEQSIISTIRSRSQVVHLSDSYAQDLPMPVALHWKDVIGKKGMTISEAKKMLDLHIAHVHLSLINSSSNISSLVDLQRVLQAKKLLNTSMANPERIIEHLMFQNDIK